MHLNPDIYHSLLLNYEELINEIAEIDLERHAQTRNYLNGEVSKLSPFITHGILTTKEITPFLLKRELETTSVEIAYQWIEPFIFQMAWRDYFHHAWEFHQDDIVSSVRHEQTRVMCSQIPTSTLNAETCINVIDDQLTRLYQTAYIHPGNTVGGLTAPFAKNINPDKYYTTEKTAQRIKKVIAGLKPEQTGDFLNWDGRQLPW